MAPLIIDMTGGDTSSPAHSSSGTSPVQAITSPLNVLRDHELTSPDNDFITHKLQDAVQHWGPFVSAAIFCHRRRKGEVAGKTLQVHLATKDGDRDLGNPKTVSLILRDWDTKNCFWTLTIDNKRFAVKLRGKQSSEGPHWQRWLGVPENFEDQAIAFPIENDDEEETVTTTQPHPAPTAQMIPTPEPSPFVLFDTTTEQEIYRTKKRPRHVHTSDDDYYTDSESSIPPRLRRQRDLSATTTLPPHQHHVRTPSPAQPGHRLPKRLSEVNDIDVRLFLPPHSLP
ncbi:MAG: hypothetical protein Q9170_007424 [Blastenia crenularia]